MILIIGQIGQVALMSLQRVEEWRVWSARADMAFERRTHRSWLRRWRRPTWNMSWGFRDS